MLSNSFLNLGAKEKNRFISGLVTLQALWRKHTVRKSILYMKKIISAATKIQAAFRRFFVLKHLVVTREEKLTKERDYLKLCDLDELCGFYTPLDHSVRAKGKETAVKAIPFSLSSNSPPDSDHVNCLDFISEEMAAKITSSPNSARYVIKAMQLEIKRLQRLVARKEPPIPVDSPLD